MLQRGALENILQDTRQCDGDTIQISKNARPAIPGTITYHVLISPSRELMLDIIGEVLVMPAQNRRENVS